MICDLPTVLPELLPRLWTFAMRLSDDRHVANDLVERACAFGLKESRRTQSCGSALCRMYSSIYSMWAAASGKSAAFADPARERGKHAATRTPAGCAAMTTADRIIAAVSALPHAERVVFLLVAVEGLSIDEAAQILDIPPHAVSRRLYEGRLAIGNQMLDECPPAAASR
ncbi:RNA polymerase sigma-70 factor (ECF subfamily) [Paraburkholderia sp. BL8N3]|jgi:RNA polymerase sigma-70 factor (ECF subfamily)|nr:sigma factor-like helix-turn-helix DNA-binding protein [Paraburkholderia sp. BL8N3]TCK34670.1 RNA polymerase sigma-70 factor (ECF subfamily) [Paraburkholderia sp. BL8N3]